MAQAETRDILAWWRQEANNAAKDRGHVVTRYDSKSGQQWQMKRGHILAVLQCGKCGDRGYVDGWEPPGRMFGGPLFCSGCRARA